MVIALRACKCDNPDMAPNSRTNKQPDRELIRWSAIYAAIKSSVPCADYAIGDGTVSIHAHALSHARQYRIRTHRHDPTITWYASDGRQDWTGEAVRFQHDRDTWDLIASLSTWVRGDSLLPNQTNRPH